MKKQKTLTDNHNIEVSDAKLMTTAYRECPLSADYQKRLAVAYSKEAMERLMNQEGCSGIRCYFAHNSTGLLTLVMVAFDKDGNDLLEELAEMGMPFPPFSSGANDLNSSDGGR